MTVFVEAFSPPPRMVILGAVDFSAALSQIAKVLGYRVTVCDARAVFATPIRFPAADEVVVDWPDRYLKRVGAGPRPPRRGVRAHPRHQVRRTGHRRRARDRGRLHRRDGVAPDHGAARRRELREAGVGDAELSRVRAPIGLDLGARTPEETAVSICAEIIASQTGTEWSPRSAGAPAPIHRNVPAS